MVVHTITDNDQSLSVDSGPWPIPSLPWAPRVEDGHFYYIVDSTEETGFAPRPRLGRVTGFREASKMIVLELWEEDLDATPEVRDISCG